MIYDKRENIDLYNQAGSLMGRAIEYVKNFDASRADGEWEIEGEALRAILVTYETKPVEECRFETHEKYIDLQVMLSGSERTDIAQRGELAVGEAYSAETDAQFYAPPKEFSTLGMKAGEFVIFYPHDAHRPAAHPGGKQTVRKLVLKISAAS